MARFTLPASIGAIRGSIGSVCFSSGNFGSVVYAKPITKRPRATNRISPQSAFATCANFWRNSVSAYQKSAWDSHAPFLHALRFPQSRTLPSGWCAFLLFNRIRASNNMALTASPPPTPERYPLPNWITNFASATTTRTYFTSQNLLSGQYCQLILSRPLTESILAPQLDYNRRTRHNGPNAGIAYYVVPVPRYSGSYIWFSHILFGPDRYPSKPLPTRALWP